jgi:hypothetical protein
MSRSNKLRARKTAARPSTFRLLVKTLPPDYKTPVTTIVLNAWSSLTREEQELLLPRLLSHMPGWRTWKKLDINLWLEFRFEDAGIPF